MARGCSASGEAEAKTGMIVKIIAGEKCILAKQAKEPVTVEPLMCNEEERVRCQRWNEWGLLWVAEIL